MPTSCQGRRATSLGSMRGLRARQEYQFFGALFRAAPGLAYGWWLLLALRGLLPAGIAVATGALIGAVESGRSLAGAAHRRRHRLRAVPGAHSAAPRDQRQPRQPDRGIPLRPPDDGDDRAPGIAHLETSRPHHRPDRRPRLRPRHHRPAAVDQHGLHRERPRRDGRRLRLGDAALRVRVVGRSAAHRRVALDALPPARVRGVARSQHRRGAHRAAPRRLRVPARGRRAGGQGGAPLRALRLGHRPLHDAPPPSLRAPVEVDATARASPRVERAAGARRERARCVVDCQRRR